MEAKDEFLDSFGFWESLAGRMLTGLLCYVLNLF
jgi:hypothetical protein